MANATSNSTYYDAAARSFQFIYSHLYFSGNRTFSDSLDLETCANAAVKWDLMLDGALFLEGTALLGSAMNNDTLRNLYVIILQYHQSFCL